jgi:hypothetical protein
VPHSFSGGTAPKRAGLDDCLDVYSYRRGPPKTLKKHVRIIFEVIADFPKDQRESVRAWLGMETRVALFLG